MALKIIFLEEFGKAFVPKNFRPNLRRYMLKADFDEVPYKFFGLLFYVTALMTTLIFIIFVYPYLKVKYESFGVGVLSFLSWFLIQLFFATLFILLVYFYLDLKIYYRTKKMEEQLPDFLQVLSANLKGGMTFERALWSAVKPRFNVLGSEMAKASKKVMTGYEVGRALTELADKYDSLMLRRTVDLIISELESGGNVAELIDRLVDNLKETKALKDEMSAAAIAYVIFISVIVVVISPLLFALSFNLLILIINFIGKLSVATQKAATLPFVFSKVSINPQDFRMFSVAAIFVISLFSSLIVSIVEKGDMKGGLKYIPIYVFGSISLYFLFMKILGALFGGII
ncbi:type II secretion system F family protein [Candidatus Woesearchaeota archaeon]|nr:type II secretion system F family protein [Candidatus Woesearchaeota archaeon]